MRHILCGTIAKLRLSSDMTRIPNNQYIKVLNHWLRSGNTVPRRAFCILLSVLVFLVVVSGVISRYSPLHASILERVWIILGAVLSFMIFLVYVLKIDVSVPLCRIIFHLWNRDIREFYANEYQEPVENRLYNITKHKTRPWSSSGIITTIAVYLLVVSYATKLVGFTGNVTQAMSIFFLGIAFIFVPYSGFIEWRRLEVSPRWKVFLSCMGGMMVAVSLMILIAGWQS